MKDGTRYAAQVRKVYFRLRQQAPQWKRPEGDDPIRQLAVAILSRECNEEVAQRAVDRLLHSMASWNEVRVSTPAEVQRCLGNTIPQVLARCKHLRDGMVVMTVSIVTT